MSGSEGLVASADAGAITGEFKVSVESLATKTEMASSNRSSQKLGGSLDPTESLRDLPLHTAIELGTFTIDGRTFHITNLNMSLQELMDEINLQVTSIPGVNPENDSSAVTISYDSATDRMVIDSGEKLPSAESKLPVLGSSTDTSNFLQAMRLLSRNAEWTDADIESGSLVSSFSAGDESKAWLMSGDRNSSVYPGDPRSYAELNGKLYERIAKESNFESGTDYLVGEKVYHQGFLYEAISNLPSSVWDGTQISAGNKVRHGSKSFELLVDLEVLKVDLFSSVDSGSHAVDQVTNPTGTVPASSYQAGDIVKSGDGSFFRSIKDRYIPNSIDWSTYSSSTGFSGSIGGSSLDRWGPSVFSYSGQSF